MSGFPQLHVRINTPDVYRVALGVHKILAKIKTAVAAFSDAVMQGAVALDGKKGNKFLVAEGVHFSGADGKQIAAGIDHQVALVRAESPRGGAAPSEQVTRKTEGKAG